MNPEVLEHNLPEGIRGIYYKNKKAFIVLNSNLTHAEKICTVTEELIHHYYYPDCNYYNCQNCLEINNCNWIENRVSKKVAELLIPEIVLETHVLPYVDIYPLCIIAKDINVTEEILRIRLEMYRNEIVRR